MKQPDKRTAPHTASFVRWCRYIGLQTRRYARRTGRRVVGLMYGLLYRLGALFYAVGLWIGRCISGWLRTAFGEVREMARDMRRARSHIYRAILVDGERRGAVLRRYTAAAVRRYRGFFDRLLHVLLPVAGCLALAFTISYFSGVTFALEINYNGRSLGYIEDESVYNEARSSANALLAADGDGSANVLKTQPSYALRIVRPGELTDAGTLRDRLIEASDYDLTEACGVYIDGELLCAVRNETDVVRVLDTLLEPVRQANPGTIVDFVQDVEYVQGLYPDLPEILWDADRLLSTVQGTRQAAVRHTVAAGETLSGIAQQYDKSSAELIAMNPGLTETLHQGQVITVSSEERFLKVRVIRTQQREEEIPYETIRTESDRYFKGINKTTREGQNGLDRVTELVSYVDGVRIGAEEIARERIREPVAKLVTVGTRYADGLPGGTITSGGGQMLWPVDGLHQISSPYGYRSSGMHSGIDITGSGATGHRIRAAESGRVTYAGYDSDYGYNVIIDHGGGLKTRYAHCSSLSVTAGQYVEMGEEIGRVGNTGDSEGPHLHFEVYKYGTRVNPLPYIT